MYRERQYVPRGFIFPRQLSKMFCGLKTVVYCGEGRWHCYSEGTRPRSSAIKINILIKTEVYERLCNWRVKSKWFYIVLLRSSHTAKIIFMTVFLEG